MRTEAAPVLAHPATMTLRSAVCPRLVHSSPALATPRTCDAAAPSQCVGTAQRRGAWCEDGAPQLADLGVGLQQERQGLPDPAGRPCPGFTALQDQAPAIQKPVRQAGYAAAVLYSPAGCAPTPYLTAGGVALPSCTCCQASAGRPIRGAQLILAPNLFFVN